MGTLESLIATFVIFCATVDMSTAATCKLFELQTAGSLPETMTVTNCHGCELAKDVSGTHLTQGDHETMRQGYNYPEPLGYGQQRVWYNTAGGPGSLGCVGKAAGATASLKSNFGEHTKTFNSAYDGNRPELAAISERYVKVYVNNGGYNAAEHTDTRSTIYYSLCRVDEKGAETCPPKYNELGEYSFLDNPFILISDLPDGEYNLKVYSRVTHCTHCPTVRSDSAHPLQIPFVVITQPPAVELDSTVPEYINKDHAEGFFHWRTNLRSRWSGKNSDTAHGLATSTLSVYHSFFQYRLPRIANRAPGDWQPVIPDDDNGRGIYHYSLTDETNGNYTFEVLNWISSNYSTGRIACSPASCSSECTSKCLSDFSNLPTFDNSSGAFSASPLAVEFFFDGVDPKTTVGCDSNVCSGPIYGNKTLLFRLSCSETCSFYCAVDGKPTLNAAEAPGLRKGYTPCSPRVAVQAAPSGSHTFTAYGVDLAGNIGEISTPFTFYTDNTPPLVFFAGVAKRCLVNERYFVPDFTNSGPTRASNVGTENPAGGTGGICIPDNGVWGDDGTASMTIPDTRITGTYGSVDCTCGTHMIKTDDLTKLYTYNQGTFPSLMRADSDTSLNAYLGYYPKSVPDKGLYQVSQRLTGTQYLIDGSTVMRDSDGVYDFDAGNGGSLKEGFLLYDVGTARDTEDDISKTEGMYDTVVQVDMDITREVYNLPEGKYGAVLATKEVNGHYYYHVLHATNSPNAKANMICKHPEIKNCYQSPQNPFQMDCGMMIT
eukprot:CAMPEP_0177582828 /NCGR_PEP_ID=MMETSP0419_2-20121207/2979_1 /TAXON_ID=582737 /ORGANISM="Tetraselmis sp., Strain GSL018" /LENGTH=770 /DNA_ID=CAMNT_0019072143 /DNA_START=287 /DNA_END=2599 /DNA_ORIENTATION=+